MCVCVFFFSCSVLYNRLKLPRIGNSLFSSHYCTCVLFLLLHVIKVSRRISAVLSKKYVRFAARRLEVCSEWGSCVWQWTVFVLEEDAANLIYIANKCLYDQYC